MDLNGLPSCAARRASRRWPWAAGDWSDMLTMNLEGLEMIAVLVVVVLFVKVLERFGLLAAIYDGKEMANSFHTRRGGGLSSSLQQSATCCPS